MHWPEHESLIGPDKGTYLSKALTYMNIFLYKQELLFCQGDGYFWPHCCMINLYPSVETRFGVQKVLLNIHNIWFG